MSAQIVNVLVTFSTLAVLGRILTPAEFGLFGLVIAVQAVIKPMLDMGLQPAYIKIENVSEGTSNAFFTINVATGVLGGILVAALAPWIAQFYSAEQLKILLPVFALSFVLAAASGQPIAVQRRNKRFDRISIVNTSVLIVGAAMAVVFAWLGFGVWALVWRAIIEAGLRFFIYLSLTPHSYRIVGYLAIRPHIRDIGFGIEIVASRLLGGWTNAFDKLALGKFSAVAELGGYTRSQQLALMPDANIRTSITSPALSYLARQKTDDKLENYLFLLWVVFVFAGTPCLILVTYGDLLLPLILGDQWIEFGWILQCMGLYGLGRVFQGYSAIYHIDRKVVKWTNIYLLGSVFGVLLLPITLLIRTESSFYFIVSIAVLSVCYWLLALFHAFFRDWSNALVDTSKALLKITFIVLSTLTSMFFVKETLLVGSKFEILAKGISSQVALLLLLIFILHKRELRRALNSIRATP